MSRRLKRGTWAATVVLVLAAFCLLGAAVAGLTASLALAVAFAGLAVLVYAAAPDLRATALGRLDAENVLPSLPLAPALAALVVLAFLDATAGELQALGGFVGLAGMAVYFLRPLVHLLVGLARRVATA